MPSGWGPSLPITRSDEDGFKLTKEIKEQIKQNFKMLLLTIPGERTWDINFGIGLKKYLFEPNVESTHRTIALRIDEQVKTINCRKDQKKGCNGKPSKCITHDLWDELDFHINTFFEKKCLSDLIENKKENRLL